MRVGRSLNRVVRGEKKKRERETWCLTNLNSNLSIKGKGDSESGLGVCREWSWCGGPGQAGY